MCDIGFYLQRRNHSSPDCIKLDICQDDHGSIERMLMVAGFVAAKTLTMLIGGLQRVTSLHLIFERIARRLFLAPSVKAFGWKIR